MNIQNIVSDVRSRVESAGRNYQDAFKAYVDAQRKAVGVVTKNGQTLANTEIGAAKNVFAAARASFDKARADGVRKVARNPHTYVPNGRDQIVSAYKDTIDLLVRTGTELTDVVSNGYKSVLGKLGTAPTKPKKAGRRTASAASSAAKKTPSKTAAKRKTASTRKTTTATAKTNGATSKAASSTAKAKTTTRKRKTPAKTSTQSTAAASNDSDNSATSSS